MRRWLPRSLWILAWSFWAWLGFGLYRELPRHVERKEIASPRDERRWFCGDMDDGTSVTRIDGDDAGLPNRYQVVDTATGRLLHECKGPDQDYPRWESSRLSVVAGVNRDAVEAETEEPFQLLDLRTGTWTALGGVLLHIEGEHPSRPWIIIDDGTAVSSRLRVYDVDAKHGSSIGGKRTTSRPPRKKSTESGLTATRSCSSSNAVVAGRRASAPIPIR